MDEVCNAVRLSRSNLYILDLKDSQVEAISKQTPAGTSNPYLYSQNVGIVLMGGIIDVKQPI